MNGSETSPARRVLSGIQPSGQLHLGNYFGAIVQHVAQQAGAASYYFIADYHALTTLTDREELRRYTLEVAAVYLALGLDPDRCVFFRQSDVPEVCELTWLLLTATPMGELERATSYKDKIARGIAPTAGLFIYPALMAADILAYDSTHVPVGRDQLQHVEIAREIVRAFHARYGREVFVEPEAQLGSAPTVPGTDGKKMSKSYDNHVPIMITGKPLEKRLARIVTDSKGLEDPKDPTTCNVYALWSLFATEAEKVEMAERYRRGGYGYGHAKAALRDKIEERFGPARARYESLLGDLPALESILLRGAEKARAVAGATLRRAREACGLSR